MQYQCFPAEIDQLHRMLGFIEDFGKGKKIPHDILEKIILASEEALVNVIHYGYPERGENGIVEITCQDYPIRKGLEINIQDRGIPFNPVEQEHYHQLSDPIILENTQSLGGHGIHIFMGIMDRVEYQRLANGNRLTLIKYF